MSLTAFARRIFHPSIDTPHRALSAANNGAFAGAMKAIDRLAWGVFVVTSGAPIEAAASSLIVGAVLGFAALIAMSGSRIAISVILAWTLLELIILPPPVWHLWIEALAIILCVGGLRGAFALAAFKRQARGQNG